MTSIRLGLASRVSKSNSKSASSVNITKYGSKVSSALDQRSHSDLAKPCYTNATPRLPLICQSHDTILTLDHSHISGRKSLFGQSWVAEAGCGTPPATGKLAATGAAVHLDLEQFQIVRDVGGLLRVAHV